MRSVIRTTGTIAILWILSMGTSVGSSPVSQDGRKWTSNDLNGPVHVMRQQTTNFRQVGDEWIEEEPRDEYVSTYDRTKLVLEKEWLQPILPPLPQKTFTCFGRDPMGKIVQAFQCDASHSPIDGFREVFLYDSKGYLAEQQMIYLDEIPSRASREVYQYDETGLKVSEREYDAHGALTRVVTLERDPTKHALSVSARTGDGMLWSKSRHICDDKGRPIESVNLDPDDQILSTHRMTYDSYGNWIERTSSGQGLDLREVVVYEYDRWGNWTKKTSRVIGTGGESRWTIRRTIEYFPD
mgnify:CR=1 FL=1